MNRREFTASLGALAASPALPLPLSAAAAPQSAVVPAGTYAWAELIARAQPRCSAAMLARHLRLKPDVAQQLFSQLLRDGVLRAPTAAGIAQAAKPIDAIGTRIKPPHWRLPKQHDLLQAHNDTAPLVKDDSLSVGCDSTLPEEFTDARTDQHVQESPE